MRSFTPAERRARLARRHLLADNPITPSITEATSALIGWHATDPATPYLSLWARIPDFTVADLDHELYERRSVVKHLAMRRTLWLLPSARLATVQPAASDRVADTERRKLIAEVVRSGVADDGASWLDTAGAAVLRQLAASGPASTAELRAALPELAGTHDPAPGKRWGGQTQLAPRVLTVLAVSGAIVRGHNDGGWTTARPRWVSTATWLGAETTPLDPATARAQLVRDWLRAFGPATLADVKWWFGSTLGSIRHALAEIGAVDVDLHGKPGYALADDLDSEPDPEPWGSLLPGLDVTTMGWFDRDWYLGAHRGQVFDANGNAGPTAWWGGHVVGGWCQDSDGRVHLQLLEDVGRDGRKVLTRKAAELTEWLDGKRILPRFPSVLSKAGPPPLSEE